MSLLSMTKTVLKSLFGKKSTRLYPFEERKPFAATRGGIGIEIDKCIYCKICEKKCPSDAIKVDKDKRTWEIETIGCLYCGYCVEVCPKKCLFQENKYYEATTGSKVDKHQGPPAPPKPAKPTPTNGNSGSSSSAE